MCQLPTHSARPTKIFVHFFNNTFFVLRRSFTVHVCDDHGLGKSEAAAQLESAVQARREKSLRRIRETGRDERNVKPKKISR
jgi:hypothetical protein